jgi:hypothetical protein
MTGYVAPCLDKAPDLVATSLSRGSGIILFLLLLRSDIRFPEDDDEDENEFLTEELAWKKISAITRDQR